MKNENESANSAKNDNKTGIVISPAFDLEAYRAANGLTTTARQKGTSTNKSKVLSRQHPDFLLKVEKAFSKGLASLLKDGKNLNQCYQQIVTLCPEYKSVRTLEVQAGTELTAAMQKMNIAKGKTFSEISFKRTKIGERERYLLTGYGDENFRKYVHAVQVEANEIWKSIPVEKREILLAIESGK